MRSSSPAEEQIIGAVPSDTASSGAKQHDQHIAGIVEQGRFVRQKRSGRFVPCDLLPVSWTARGWKIPV